ncbi:MAG: response regulator [Chloroflexota bacterium]|nr:response regulator [Chloroflexota bacterium]
MPAPPSILVVDDQRANRELLEAQLASGGYEIRQAADGVEALESVEHAEPDLILLDIEMPRLNGIEVCRRLKRDPRRRLIPIVILTAQVDRETRLAGLAAGADDFLTKPFDGEEVLVRSRVLLRERALNQRLDNAEAVILALARAVEARDLYTVHHAERVGTYARAIGRALGFGESELDDLYKGGVLHDLGKIAVPDSILLKPKALTDEEWVAMKGHSAEGERIAAPLRSTSALLPTIRHHHERFDGRGYPDHLVGVAIPAHARIAALADAYDAMVSDRPYRRGLGIEEARKRMREGAGTQWDPTYAEIFLHLLDAGTLRSIESAGGGVPAV